MFDKIGLHDTVILMFFAFLGGLTRELNEIITDKLNIRSFTLGLITASTTGIIVSQLLLSSNLGFHMSCFLTGIAGFMGPYVLLAISKIIERKLEAYGTPEMNDVYQKAKTGCKEDK